MLSQNSKLFLNSYAEKNDFSAYELNRFKILPDIDCFLFKDDPMKYGNYRIIQEISYKCSANCPYCMNKGLDYSEPELPVEEYINFYEKLIKENNAKLKLKISGGEPTQPNVLHRTNQLMEYAIKNPNIYAIQINTNGYWPIPIEWKSDKVKIQFSLDGNEQRMVKNTGYIDIYQKLLNNFDYCVKNNINFQFRCVVSSMDEIQDLIPIIKKYQKFAVISMATPVGGATQYNIDEYLNMILKVDEYNAYFEKEKIPANVRIVVGYCDQVYLPGYLNFMITPSGRIGNCPFLATKLLSNYTIYTLDINNLSKFRQELLYSLQDKTCYFPNGFLNFWNALTESQKAVLNDYISQSHRANIMPSLQEYYSLT